MSSTISNPSNSNSKLTLATAIDPKLTKWADVSDDELDEPTRPNYTPKTVHPPPANVRSQSSTSSPSPHFSNPSPKPQNNQRNNQYSHQQPMSRSTSQGARQPFPNNPPFKAYIGNLAFDVRESEIEEFFHPHQVTQIQLIKQDGENGEQRLKGFGYVTFATSEGLKSALEKHDSVFVGQRRIKIDLAKSSDDRSNRDNRNDKGEERNFSSSYERRGNERNNERHDRNDRNDRNDRHRNGDDNRRSDNYRNRDRDGERNRDRNEDRADPPSVRRSTSANSEPQEPSATPTGGERKKLSLLPRTGAVPAGSATPNSSIFGNARPREEVLAGRGKDETAAPVADSPVAAAAAAATPEPSPSSSAGESQPSWAAGRGRNQPRYNRGAGGEERRTRGGYSNNNRDRPTDQSGKGNVSAPASSESDGWEATRGSNNRGNSRNGPKTVRTNPRTNARNEEKLEDTKTQTIANSFSALQLEDDNDHHADNDNDDTSDQ